MIAVKYIYIAHSLFILALTNVNYLDMVVKCFFYY